MGGGSRWYPDWPVRQPVPEKLPRDDKGRFVPKAGSTDELALHQYNDLRFTCHELEELIASVEGDPGWSEKDLKRLDKAVTVMKVGFKILKKVLKSRARRHVSQQLEHAE